MAKKKVPVPFQNFLFNEHDHYGRSVPVYFRIQPGLDKDLNNLLRAGRTPFQTREEVARWAFCLGIRSLCNLRQFDLSYRLFQFPIELYEPSDRIEADEFIKHVERIVRNLSALGYRTPELHRFISVIEDLVECLPSSYDREQYPDAA